MRLTVPTALLLMTAAHGVNAQPSILPPLAPPSPTLSAPRLGGYVQARETLERRIGLTGTLNRVRLSADGSLPNRFTYRVMAEFEAGGSARAAAGVSLRDAYVRWSRAWYALQAGQFKTPFSRSYLTSITAIETADRPAVVDTLATKRDIGVMAEAAPIPELSFSLGAFNGEGQNIPANRDSSVMVVARAVARPLSQLQFGASGASYGGDSTRYGVEASVEEGGALLRGEWIAQHRRGRSGDDRGWFVLAGLRVLAWAQVVVMREDLERPTLGAAGRLRATTVGANLDLGASRTRLIVNGVSRRAGAAQSRRSLIAQVQVRF